MAIYAMAIRCRLGPYRVELPTEEVEYEHVDEAEPLTV